MLVYLLQAFKLYTAKEDMLPADSFPNIMVLLTIACTLPVTVCEKEHSNSQIKLLKNYLRSTMSEERLTGLAMTKIHRDKPIDMDSLVQLFAI